MPQMKWLRMVLGAYNTMKLIFRETISPFWALYLNSIRRPIAGALRRINSAKVSAGFAIVTSFNKAITSFDLSAPASLQISSLRRSRRLVFPRATGTDKSERQTTMF